MSTTTKMDPHSSIFGKLEIQSIDKLSKGLLGTGKGSNNPMYGFGQRDLLLLRLGVYYPKVLFNIIKHFWPVIPPGLGCGASPEGPPPVVVIVSLNSLFQDLRSSFLKSPNLGTYISISFSFANKSPSLIQNRRVLPSVARCIKLFARGSFSNPSRMRSRKVLSTKPLGLRKVKPARR